ncbi:tyrosinase family protein [Paraliomyxa miuraensis]|uniref:tyrosinase family protein n=1 Tax=Paraliomyxa miuraensis TaxID=376150 RepID=UPI0022596ED7|nr:tyrosinase family protein [Paraliomyxa miuraensis]MCX4248002.1 tyrosinase family protein [Paraliomyxa miuraensis]
MSNAGLIGRSLLGLACLLFGACGDQDAVSQKKEQGSQKIDATKEKVGEKIDATKEKVGEKVAELEQGFYDWSNETKHDVLCKVMDGMIGNHDGVPGPGTAGAARWGIPAKPPAKAKVRRSYSSLSDAEKKKVVDAFVALKKVTTGSGSPGSSRANYDSICGPVGQPQYERNLYDYYVEAHMNAFMSMGTPVEAHHSMSHMGPQFLPWHRYLLLRVEADLAEAIGDPEFTLPYWDWTDCHADGDPKTCAPIFQREFLGTGGSCNDDARQVEGYLTDQGFQLNITTQGNTMFVPDAIVCNQPRPLHRQVGCEDLIPTVAGQAEIDAMFARPTYDAAPYDSCNTEEDVSFRQYLEGYDNDDTNMTCVAVGCATHSSGHIFIGADMYESSGSPNDPLFFIHHAQVDRLWAAWQQANLAKGGEAAVDHGNPGYPETHRGSLFVWPEVLASEMFDYQALGYQYDTLPSPK